MQQQMRVSLLGKIRPDNKEEERVKAFVESLLSVAKTISGYDCVVCGSIGKFTWLKGDHDIDLFILFPRVPRAELESRGIEFGKKIAKDMKGKFVIKYAEHPYVHASISGFDVDIVPCYRLNKGEKIISAVDRSPLHLEYIIEKLGHDLRDDVRLLKQFCKGIKAYGSDARHMGFSGYMCELLVLNYGLFEDVLKAVAKWEAPVIIDVEGLAGKINAKERFPGQPLIIIDPTDKDRNVAANLSSDNMMKFVSYAKKFIASPDEKYFFPKSELLSKSKLDELKNRETKFIAITMKKPDIIDDILFPQMRKAANRLCTLLRHNEFVPIRCLEFADKTNMIILFEMEVWQLPRIKKMVGPHIFSKKHSEEFLSKYKGAPTGVEGANWVAEKSREFQAAASLLKGFIKKDSKELVASGVPENIAKVMVTIMHSGA